MASDGHPGFGGFDLFVAKVKSSGGTVLYNLNAPFNSAKDLINIAGYAAENILKGTLKVINHDALWDYQKANDALLIDVRTKEEFSRGHIPGAINHNVDELRALLPTLDPSRKYIIYCQVGLRGYLANKILSNHGFDTVNLQGGYHLWNKLYPQNN